MRDWTKEELDLKNRVLAGETFVYNVSTDKRKAPHRHFHEWAEVNGYAVYIGDANRWRGLKRSAWYNPYHKSRGMTDSEREEAIRLFREKRVPHLLNRIPELKGGKALGCWCAPKLCHGNVLVELVEER